MSRRKSMWTILVVAGGVAFNATACDDEEETEGPVVVPPTCEAGAMQCGDENMALVCPADGSGWVSYPCAGGCANDVCSTEPCTPGAAECVNDNLAQICPADGSGWLAVACGVGESCTDGVCDVSSNGKTICTAGTAECASSNVVRTCDTDGTDWFYMGCPSGYVCDSGACVVDTTNALCTPGDGFCTDATTAWVCNENGQGFTETSCPSGTDCISGMCVGDNCIVGQQYCLNAGVLVECTDGTEWTETACAADEICAEYANGFDAECITRACDPYTQACGNPDNAAVSETDYYSVCELDMWGNLTWVQYECAPPTECDPTALDMTATPCRAECMPGAERCVGDERQVCDANGNWGAGTPCNSGGGSYLECVVKPASETGDGLADALCADPVCGYLFGTYGWDEDEIGVCDGSQILTCDASTGALATTAADCSSGTCVASGVVYGGQSAGMCVEQCEAGEERCFSGGGLSPLYQTCVNGVWSATLQSCTTGMCWDTTSGGLSATTCAECLDGRQRCNGNQIETCTSGAWGTAVDCTLGVCQPMGNTAACVAECNPGQSYCSGAPVLASDGSSYGYTEESVCGNDGMFPATPTACTGTETCRITNTGIETGCIECLDGSQGGNELGIADSRCATSTSLQICTSSAWPTATDCGTNEVCDTIGAPPECTSCTADNQPCTESYIVSLGYPTGCAALNYWSTDDFQPMSCGSVPDCCHDPGYGMFCEPADVFSRASACVPGTP